MVQPLWRTIWRVLKTPNKNLLHDSAILPLGIYSETTLIQKDTGIPMFTALFIIGKVWKQPKCLLTDEWRKNMGYIFATEYYSAIKKSETIPLIGTKMQ